MTPKEKAKELIEKFMPYMYCYMGSGMLSNDYDEKTVIDNTIQCALITCNEVLEEINHCPTNGYGLEYIDVIKYWEEVKKEIQRFKLEDCGC